TPLAREVPVSLGSAGLPPEVAGALASGAGGAQNLTGVGDMGASILASLPPDVRGLVEPFIPTIVGAIHDAFSIATASTFVVGIVSSLAAAGLVLLFREAPATAAAWQEATGDDAASQAAAACPEP